MTKKTKESNYPKVWGVNKKVFEADTVNMSTKIGKKILSLEHGQSLNVTSSLNKDRFIAVFKGTSKDKKSEKLYKPYYTGKITVQNVQDIIIRYNKFFKGKRELELVKLFKVQISDTYTRLV